MELIEITDEATIISAEIIDRTKQSSKNRYTQHYLVKENGVEIAFLSLDLMYNHQSLFLYELFVVNSKRKNGYGNKILDLVFDFAKKDSFNEIRVEPHPFDGTMTLDVLNRFYMNKGFEVQEEHSQLSKKVNR